MKRHVIVRPYNSPAGGWGALEAVAKALVVQDAAMGGAATLFRMNQPDGFDRPDCAWPDPKDAGAFHYCENGAKDDLALRDDELDIDLIRGHTAGFEAYTDDLRRTEWPATEAQSGLERDDLVTAARVYAGAQNVIRIWGMGITQHRHGTRSVQQIVNLLLLRGNIGRPGAGACPARGHSNVQGNRTVGITEKPTTEFLDRMAEVFAFDPPRGEGHNVVRAVAAMACGGGAYYPEANPLIPLSHHDPDSGTPSAKSIPVRLRPHAEAAP